jgi:hypothetical protein
MLVILMLKIVKLCLRKSVLNSFNSLMMMLVYIGKIKNSLLSAICMLLKIFSLFLSVLKLNGVLNSLLVILEILLSMMLIYSSVSDSDMSLGLFIKQFGLSLSNMDLSKNSSRSTLRKEHWLRKLILFLEIYISLS